MAMRLLILLAAFAVWAHPAQAAGGDKKKAGPSNVVKANFTLEPDRDEEPFERLELVDSPRAVDMRMVPMPVIRQGRLQHYMFVSMRLMVEEGYDTWQVREQSHRLRDAVVRAAHRPQAPVTDATGALDRDGVIAMVRAATAAVVEADRIEDIIFTSVASQADF